MRSFWVAVGCLTILPFGPRGRVEDSELGRSLLWFPLVGLVIGAVLVDVNVLASRAFPTCVVGACVLLAWIVITGALHLDGLGDVADGLSGGRTREERLRIMKDPHLGAMAVVAIAMLLILKYSVLSSLSFARRNQALFLVPCLGRYAMVLLGSTLPSARAGQGTAGPFIQHRRRSSLVLATAMSLAASWLILGLVGLGMFGVMSVGSFVMRAVFQRALGGITGDALGAAGETIEALLLCVTALITT
ncbi:MAG: adenosylcobinamide-GDP ribazoletransferase [Candidatus Omnitrophica bacterium]|nr:adenosylcobinamide-GDP ribazoletransferase [Candidatus Omnitrophota bacterium]